MIGPKHKLTRPPLPPEPEAVLQNKIIRFAGLLRWRIYHPWTSIHSASGYPDLTMVRAERLVFAELKSDDGEATPAQLSWLEDLKRVPCAEVYLWRPSDWQRIVEVLRR